MSCAARRHPGGGDAHDLAAGHGVPIRGERRADLDRARSHAQHRDGDRGERFQRRHRSAGDGWTGVRRHQRRSGALRRVERRPTRARFGYRPSSARRSGSPRPTVARSTRRTGSARSLATTTAVLHVAVSPSASGTQVLTVYDAGSRPFVASVEVTGRDPDGPFALTGPFGGTQIGSETCAVPPTKITGSRPLPRRRPDGALDPAPAVTLSLGGQLVWADLTWATAGRSSADGVAVVVNGSPGIRSARTPRASPASLPPSGTPIPERPASARMSPRWSGRRQHPGHRRDRPSGRRRRRPAVRRLVAVRGLGAARCRTVDRHLDRRLHPEPAGRQHATRHRGRSLTRLLRHAVGNRPGRREAVSSVRESTFTTPLSTVGATD